MGGLLNKKPSFSRGGLFAPTPAILGPVCLICLDEVPRPWDRLPGALSPVGQLEIRSARIRANAGSADNRLDRLRLARLNTAVNAVSVGRSDEVRHRPYL